VKYCPITYEPIAPDAKYSDRGLKSLAPTLRELHDFPYSADQQRREAANRAAKMSIQGIQAKLSAVLNVKDAIFEVVDKGGRFILKPQNQIYDQLPENEDLTMRFASSVGLEIPFHGLIYCADGSMTYFVKRFDRFGQSGKLALEDFAQLAGQTRDTKYDWSMERLIPIIEQHCTFPVPEKAKLLKVTLFNFLVGNEDMHLKNFSLITHDDKVELSPSYDLINTTIAMPHAQEELALPLNGKKRKLELKDFKEYFAIDRLRLPEKIFNECIATFGANLNTWDDLISRSFLNDEAKKKYRDLVVERSRRLGIGQ